MKLNKLLLTGAVALGLGLSACSNDDAPEVVDQNNGGHYLGISLSITSPSSTDTRASIEEDNKPGLTDESSLTGASAVVVAFPQGTSTTPVIKVLSLSSAYDATGAPAYKPKDEAAIEVPAGTYDVYVVVGPSAFVSAFATEVAATPGKVHLKDLYSQLQGLADISGLTTANSFVMSSRAVKQVTAQASKADAINTNNTAKVELDRLVAKVTVVTPDAAKKISTTPTTFTSELAGFTLEQGKNAEYTIMQDKLVPPALTAPIANDYNPSSPVFAAGSNYLSFPVWGNATTAFEANPTLSGRATDGGLYTTENTSVYGATNIYRVGTTTYALIRVKITPTTCTGTRPSEWDGTFYYGLSDYKFYYNTTDAAAANGSNGATPTDGTAGNNGYLKYNKGYAYYTVWVGQNYPTVNYAPVVRNRWYQLNVTKVLQLGTPYDPICPSNPKVPYVAGTDGPNTPPTPVPPTDPIVPEVKYIAAELSVKNWTAVNRDVELN